MRFLSRTLATENSQKILLVEDEAPVRMLISHILNQAGYDVTLATDAVEAVSKLKQNGASIDLLLTDVAMPGMSGVQLADYATTEFPGLGVLYVTGFRDQFPELHQTPNCLIKPFTADELLDAVEKQLAARVLAGGKNELQAKGRAEKHSRSRAI